MNSHTSNKLPSLTELRAQYDAMEHYDWEQKIEDVEQDIKDNLGCIPFDPIEQFFYKKKCFDRSMGSYGCSINFAHLEFACQDMAKNVDHELLNRAIEQGEGWNYLSPMYGIAVSTLRRAMKLFPKNEEKS